MHTTLPTSKPLFAEFFSFLRAITSPTAKIKTKILLVPLLALFCFSNAFGQAQTCTNTTTNPNAYGTGSWIGHVYDHNGTGNPVTLPFATYKGYTTETETFNRNWVTSNPGCAAGIDNFAVRYRMNKTFASGNYTFTIGGDDGVRLSIDGGATWILSAWADRSYSTVSVQVSMYGNYNLVLEYYEKGGDAQVSFSYTTACTTPSNPSTLSISGISSTALTVGFTPPATAPSGGYVVFRSTSATAPVLINGTAYTNGTTYSLPGNSYVAVSNGTAVSIPQTGLTSNTKYYYYVFSQNTACVGQPFYSTGINGNQITCAAPPTGNTVSLITANSGTISWDASVAGGSAATINYFLDVSTNAGFTPPIAGSPFSNGTSLSKALTGLTTATTYHYRIRANNGCESSIAGSFTTLLAPCSGTPTGGTTVLSPSTGLPSSPFTATVTGDTAATGLSYQWQIANSSGGPWTDISGATGASANLTAVSFQGTVKYYRRKVICANGGLAANSVYTAFTTTSPTYCSPTASAPNDLYINSFKFVGTLNDNPANVTGASGYADYTNLTPVVQQPQGSVLNIVASALGSDGKPKPGYWKAWVDFNGDGVFTDSDIVTVVGGERVYSLTRFNTESLTFGFVIPSTTPVGKYRFRIRVGDTTNFDPCSNSTYGETEDYLFEVISDCAAKVNTVGLTDVSRCGTGPVTLTATGTATGPGTGIRWYANAAGGVPLFDGSNFTTTVTENTRTTYYVVAYNSTCESVFRIPVTAIANPGPTVNFGSVPSFCAATTPGQVITATNGKRLDVLLDEHFDTLLGSFTQSTPVIVSGSLDEPNTYWKNKASGYIPTVPPYEGLAPALSSGYTGGNFVMSNTDYNRTGSLLNRIETPFLNTVNFDNLTLDFDLYYFTLITADTDPNLINYFSVDYSLDGINNWVNLQTIKTNQGNPNIWKKISINLPPSVLGLSTVKIRFSSYSYGTSGLFKESIAAIDNVKIYGIKDESSQFTWSSPVSGILYESTCTNPLNAATKAASICIKPTATQIENNVEFSINATANFSNGCPANGTIVVPNNARIWDNSSPTDWATNNWKPGLVPPNSDKCVIIRKPVTILANTNGLAKNVRVEATAGKLNIAANASLTVSDFFRNEAADATNVVIESDGNLKQITDNPIPANSGSVTARRNIKFRSVSTRNEYNYLISPVVGQSLKTLYPGVPTTSTYPYILYHNEANNYFYNSSGAYIAGRGLAVKEPSVAHVSVDNKDAEFKGPLANGVVTFPLAFTNSTRGYNLVGNPYASNIDLEALYALNGSSKISSTFYFWDNGANNVYIQEGSSYLGRAYAVYNAVTKTGNAAGFILPTSTVIGSKVPNKIAKVAQGFMVKTPSAGQTLTFNNSIRVVDNTGVKFFSKDAASDVNRYWLRLISPTNVVNTLAIVYVNEGSTSFGMDDSELNESSSDMFYSLAEDHQLQIEGRPAFVNTDKIILGSQHFAPGNYIIDLGEHEGIFANDQTIYLKDKQTDIMTNLSAGSYTFAANAGPSTGRFEIVYVPETVLATDGAVKENLVVYKDGNDFVVKAQTKKITGLELFDAAGRLMRSFRPNSLKAIIPADQLIKGVYILKIDQGGKITTKKVIR